MWSPAGNDSSASPALHHESQLYRARCSCSLLARSLSGRLSDTITFPEAAVQNREELSQKLERKTLDYLSARRNMVDGQLRTNRVNDPRLGAVFDSLPRELFVPEGANGFAYVDEDLPLGQERWLMEPMVLARLLQSAELGEGDTILIVGAGTGYSAAVAAALASSVVALEEE